MVTFFRKLFIKNYQDVQDEKVRAEHGKVAAIFGIISNCILVAMKLTMAFVVAASSTPWVLPMALVGDAINNLSDMASSLVTLIGFRISAKPADREHPFGHERIEYIAGLVVSTIVIVLAIELGRDSITKIVNGELVDYTIPTIIVLGISVLIKLLQSYFNYGMGKAISSPALKATSVDSLTDSIATFCITVSAILSLEPLKWNFLDGYMGIVVALFVCYSGIRMLKETADPLIGESNNKAIVDEVVATVKSHPEVLGVHDVLCHSYGPTKYFISLHAEINQNMSMLDAHDIIDNIETDVRHKFHLDITIHMDPIAVGDPMTDEIKKEVSEELAALSKELSFHDFRIVPGKTHTNVIFDVVLPYEDSVNQKMVMDGLKAKFKDHQPEYHFVVNFDHSFNN
jgi:cation diffusion facilitator family transporter